MEAAEQDRRRKEYAATLESDVLHLKEKLEALQARDSRTSSALQSAVQETRIQTGTPTLTLTLTLTSAIGPRAEARGTLPLTLALALPQP